MWKQIFCRRKDQYLDGLCSCQQNEKPPPPSIIRSDSTAHLQPAELPISQSFITVRKPWKVFVLGWITAGRRFYLNQSLVLTLSTDRTRAFLWPYNKTITVNNRHVYLNQTEARVNKTAPDFSAYILPFQAQETGGVFGSTAVCYSHRLWHFASVDYFLLFEPEWNKTSAALCRRRAELLHLLSGSRTPLSLLLRGKPPDDAHSEAD